MQSSTLWVLSLQICFSAISSSVFANWWPTTASRALTLPQTLEDLGIISFHIYISKRWLKGSWERHSWVIKLAKSFFLKKIASQRGRERNYKFSKINVIRKGKSTHLKRERSRPQFGEAKGNTNAVLVTPQKKLVWPPFQLYKQRPGEAKIPTLASYKKVPQHPCPGGIKENPLRNQDFHSHLGITRHLSPSPLEWCQRRLSRKLRLKATTTVIPVEATKNLDSYHSPIATRSFTSTLGFNDGQVLS